jgi:GNAT superfamily N-acetyltransferase
MKCPGGHEFMQNYRWGVIEMKPKDCEKRVYLIREFRPSDLEEAYKCFVSSFYHTHWPIVDEADPQLIKDVILLLHRIGSKTFVAEIDGAARGILVGLCPMGFAAIGRAFAVITRFVARAIAGRYRLSLLAKKHLFQQFFGSLPFLRYSLGSSIKAKTLLLISQKEYRGGIGRALMDAWIEEVQSCGFHSVTVGTDSAISWDFYERYGYRRVREFNYKGYKYSLPGERVKGYIYLYSWRQLS